ncbi:unnamed protein product [Medioppia subpectinata]|uniref:Cytochrome b561 domain-containing protein n=1 Tax=Medioppia subpectinata TaxID=1979941 RepID=A0A7R9KK60_9ACAR|nr:unnamed protein product [Medioppia subpectinata]CAG2103861.1 unnamed protein product [Medioppia subpectinata]
MASPPDSPTGVAGVQFEMFTKTDPQIQYISMALSVDNKMGSDSVTDIIVSSDGNQLELKQSWNQKDKKDNDEIAGMDGIKQIGNIVNSDGIISAKWVRDAITTPNGQEFDILKTDHNILLAKGPFKENNKKAHHSLRTYSQSEVDLKFTNEKALSHLYNTCNGKLCLGHPNGCIATKTCDQLLAITNSGYGLSDGKVAFHMIGKASNDDSAATGWIATALSLDNLMGNDAVVECLVLADGKTILRNSWNTNPGKDLTNEIIGNVMGVETTGDVVYDGGLINCKWTRAANTVVRDKTFDLSQSFYVLLAKGKLTDTTTGVKDFHSKKYVSPRALNLQTDKSATIDPSVSTPMPSLLATAYKRCTDNERLCFGYNNGKECIDTNDCTALVSLVSMSATEGTVEFELFWSGATASGYVALGLSTDGVMGDDTVTECIVDKNGGTRLGQGWTVDHKGVDNISDDQSVSELDKSFADGLLHCKWSRKPSFTIRGHSVDNISDDQSVSELDKSFADGLLHCKWSRKPSFTIRGHSFDLQNNSYYLLLAYGPLASDEQNIAKHTEVKPTDLATNLQSVGILKAAPVSIYIKLHGAFMIIAWLGCVSISILMARHYKNSWPDSTLCGVKLWFAYHRAIMVTGVVAIIIATVLIFVEKKGWSGPSPHAIIGLTAIILSLLQPIGALFRPGPDSPKRWLFNWLHWSGGYIGHILSCNRGDMFNIKVWYFGPKILLTDNDHKEVNQSYLMLYLGDE